MKRFLNPALVAIAAFATFGLAACGSSTTSSGTPVDDTTTGTDDAAIGDTPGTDATTGTDVTTADAGPCGKACAATEKCNATTGKCEALPCGGPCATAGDKCGADQCAGHDQQVVA